MISFDDLLSNSISRKGKLFSRLENPERITDQVFSSLWNIEYVEMLDAYRNGNFDLVKRTAFNCAVLDEVKIKLFNSRVFDFGIRNVCVAIISDNRSYLNSYANLEYRATISEQGIMKERSFSEMAGNGETAIWCSTILHLHSKRFEEAKINLKIIEEKNILNSSRFKNLRQDFNFYQGILNQDAKECERALNNLLSPELAKVRNEDEVFRNLIIHPVVGYLKLAMNLGLPLRLDHPLVKYGILESEQELNYSSPYLKYLDSGI